MNRPLVSVIIPAYNADKFIKDALESVFAQDYEPLEIIVVDDGSTDSTAEIIKGFQHGGRTLLYFYQENAGPSRARNLGIRAARGEFITFLDADDLWTPMKLQKQVDFMESNGEADLVFGDMQVFDSGGCTVDSAFSKHGHPPCDEQGKVVHAFHHLLQRNFVSTATVLLRKKCLNETGYFDEKLWYAEDYDLWLRFSLKFDLFCIPEIFRLKRMHDRNLSWNKEAFILSSLYTYKKLKKKINSPSDEKYQDVNDQIIKAMRELSYHHYINKDYLRAVRSMLQYFIYRLKSSVNPRIRRHHAAA
jgi:glycosyltransferase involved in cell wall biosynthesis